MSLSVVAMLHDMGDRDYGRVLSFGTSLLEQSLPPDEIIIVDTSPVSVYQSWASVKYITRPSPTFNKSRALNLGIQSAASDYIMTTDIDFIFSPDTIKVVVGHLSPGAFLLAEAGYLPEMSILPPFNWPLLTSRASDVERRKSPGTLQVAHRDFWHAVHGYDERYEGGLGGMDDDMWIRARKYGLELVWLPFGKVHCLHQWHPVSPLKGKCSHLFMPDPPIVKNLQGWGI